MSLFSSAALYWLLAAAAAAPAIVYDQRQEGTGTNVHVQLQDFLLIYMPSRVEDPASLISSIRFKSNSPAGESGVPEVTLPPEYENTSSQAVQEAIVAASPELPEPETNKPENNSSITTEPPKQSPKPTKKVSQPQKVAHSVSKPVQKTTPPQESNADKTEIHQAVAVFKIKHDQQIPVKVVTDPPKPSVKKAAPLMDSKITQAVIDSVKQKVEAVTEAQVRRLYDVFQTPVSQAVALFKIKQEPTGEKQP